MTAERHARRRALLRGTREVVQSLRSSGKVPGRVELYLGVGEVGLALESIFGLLQRDRGLRGLLSPQDLAVLARARHELEAHGYRVPPREELDGS